MITERDRLVQILAKTPDSTPGLSVSEEEIDLIEDNVQSLRQKEFDIPDLLTTIETEGKNPTTPPEVDRQIKNLKKELQGSQPIESGKPTIPYMEGAELKPEDFLTADGRHLDFSQARNWSEFIDMIAEEETVTNQLGETIPAETVICQIYERLYGPNGDWTKITLKHRLREMVYHFGRTIDQSEYANNFGAREYLKARDMDNLKEIIGDQILVNKAGEEMTGAQAILAIENGRYDVLPTPLKYKVIELQKRHIKITSTTPPSSWKTKVGSILSSAASWFSRKK